MKILCVSGLSLLLLSGCVSAEVRYDDGMRIRTAGETNLFRPSLSVMEVSVCVPEEGLNEISVDSNGETETCNGYYTPIATVQGTQSGSLTGLGGAMVQGGAIVGGAYLLGDGIRDSASRTDVNQNGGGANSNATSKARSSSSSKQYQSQHQSQTQSHGMMRRGD